MDQSTRYKQMNDLISFLKKNKFSRTDPVYILILKAVGVAARQVNIYEKNKASKNNDKSRLITILIQSKV